MTGERPNRRLVVAMAMVTAAVPLSMDMYLPAVPAMGETLGTSIANVQLTIAIFMLGLGAGMMLFGPLSDRFGRRIPLLAGVAVFVFSALGCAWSRNVGWLIGFRFLQGMGVTGGQVIVLAILTDLYSAREMSRLNSLLSMVRGLAPMLAPLLGGYLLLAFSWPAIFLVLAGYGVLAWCVAFAYIPETRSHEARTHSRAESPARSYLAVMGNRPLMRIAAVCALGSSAFWTYLSNASRLFIEDFGISPQHFGYYFAVNVIGLLCAGQLNRTLLKSHSPEWMLKRTCVAVVIAAVLFVLASLQFRYHHWPVQVALFLLVSCFPPIMANATALAQSLDRLRAGSVAAIMGAVNQGVGATAAIVSGALHNGTPVPMALTMLFCAVSALLLLRRALPQAVSA